MITKGQKINDRYEIIKSIGEGGMANVYLAQDTILDRKVAIKVLRGDLANDEKFIRRFQREALSASSLSHPNIVEMYDVGEDAGNHYIVMEYIEGKTLKQLLKKRGNLTVSEAVDIMLQLTDGIAHAHDSYIIHRDLKPQNIMIQEDGQIKITDFGIAMALNSTQLTQTNSVMGSVHYLPPEQASGKGSTIKSDIYSMGILFYELLTGVLPFKGDNAVEIALKHMKDPIPSVRKQNANIPQSVENIILKATAKNPKNRYNDVKEMYQDLRVCLDPDVMNQSRVVYKYPEHETEENKETIPSIKQKKKETPEEEKVKQNIVQIIEEDDVEPDKGKFRFVIGGLAVILVLLLAGLAIFFGPSLLGINGNKESVVPDVSGMSVEDAIGVLENEGFKVNYETQKVVSGEVASGFVIKTDPAARKSVKKDSVEVVIYESTGEETYTMENFIGSNYIKVQTRLQEVYGLVVKIEKEEVENSDEVNSQAILHQEPEEGAVLKTGDQVILYIPDVYDKYPDFVKEEGWTVETIQKFCDTYNITVEFKEQQTTSYDPGTIIRQSRAAGSKMVSGVTIVITVATEMKDSEDEPPTDDTDTDGESSDEKTDSSDGTQ